VASPVRTRDPERKSRILAATADLVARKGFHAVSMAEIGAAAGITGSGIYRHFDSKSAVLVALFDRVIDDLLRSEHEILESTPDLGDALDLLIADQVDFVVSDREVAQVYYREINNLPEKDRRSLRRKQRRDRRDPVTAVPQHRARGKPVARPARRRRSRHPRPWRQVGSLSPNPGRNQAVSFPAG
jgi:AcrR family transcriptional regulator